MSQRQELNGSDSREPPYGDRAAITLTRLLAPRAADERLRHRRQSGRTSSLGSAFTGSIPVRRQARQLAVPRRCKSGLHLVR